MAMSDLPRDLLEKILSRVPKKSIGAVRSTCKSWNSLSNEPSFTNKFFGKSLTVKESAFLVVTLMEFHVNLMSINFDGIEKDKNFESCIIMKHKGNLISLNDAKERVDIFTIFHCNGLLLCDWLLLYDTYKTVTRLVVLNPYCGQTRWIKPRVTYQLRDRYALGYEKKKNSSFLCHKILRFHDKFGNCRVYELEIYDFNSDSWRAVEFTPGWDIMFFQRGVSLKGNTYWFVREWYEERRRREIPNFLLCFDFTTERFGPRLSLPFDSDVSDTVTLSSVREDQLTILFQHMDTLRMEIWVTTKIEPKDVSWNKLFLAVDMRQITGFQFQLATESFFIDEKKNIVVILGKDLVNLTRMVAYIIGNDGYFKEVYLGESTHKHRRPIVCSYVPSSVQIKQVARVMQQQDHSFLAGKDHIIIGFGCFWVSLLLCMVFSYLCLR